ncbi:MAG: ArsA-related P-loop ATPase [Gordonia sp. (in: high G+C Gram-positive bacteria)]|uniref:ArsA family ATPase n=1 Tax=Gordonia sp. (in: high G+C Gram-positive bacteria) TaxID=84139 RepID=UPI0039E3FDB9
MTTDALTQQGSGWPANARSARLHFVSGKGGTGKTTVAAALAIAFASEGKKVLLVEVEGRQGIAQIFDVPPLPPTDHKIDPAGGGVWALAVDIEHALLEYLDMFYRLGFAAKAIKRVGAIDFVTTVAPGLRDVVITGKIKERVIAVDDGGAPLYDVVVVDAPPTGRIGNFLDVTSAMSDLAKTGPIRNQSEGVVQLLHSPETVVHLCTLLEAMPIQETIEAVDDLAAKNLHLGSIFVNRVKPQYLPDTELDAVAENRIDADALRAGLTKAGLDVSDDDMAGLIREAVDYAVRLQAQQVAQADLDEVQVPRVDLPEIDEHVDLGGLYQLARAMKEAGV